jgi:hypothetical protein
VKQAPSDRGSSRGASKAYVVTPTEHAMALSDPERSTADRVYIQTGTCSVTSVSRDEPYKNHKLPDLEEYRLVVGTYERRSRGVDDATDKETNRYKFRALLKHDPVADSWRYEVADYGEIDSEDWSTDNIPH